MVTWPWTKNSATYLSIREWLQYSYLETGLNWLTSAALMQWHAEFIADTPWQQTLCPSLSEPHIVNAFKSHYVAAVTAAEARISFELRPTISWLCSTLFTAENYCVFGWKRKKTKMKKKHFRPKTKMAETIKNCHFRHRKRKRISVGL